MKNLLTENIDIWTSAQIQKNGTGRGNGSANQSLYGIKKLRELILELAVRGKLVPQDPHDEPASVLLEKIVKEKARLIKEGKIKKEKWLEISDDEILYELPASWTWVKIGNIAQHNSGKTLDSGRNRGTLKEYITTSNLYWGFFILDNLRQMPFEDEELDKCTAKKFDLLICEGGEAGRAAVWNYSYDICFQNHIHRVRLYGNTNPFYVFRVLQKINYTGEINSYRKGVGISNMSGKSLASIILPLPPFAEQHRIVAKVDELMALCDKLEQRQADSNTAHQTLVETLLATLTSAADANEFDEAWQRIAGNFDILFTTEQSIDQLKQTILQLAVMGKLVPQNPNDEPASVLLAKIAKEKERLIKEGKIKKEKPLPEISDNEKTFEIPQGWEWTQLGTIATFENGDRSNRYPNESDLKQSGIPFFGAKDMVDGMLRFDNGLRFISKAKFNELSNGKLIDKDFVVLLRGTVGKMAIFKANSEFSTGFINAQMLIIRLIDSKICEFFKLYSTSNQFQSMIEVKTTGSAVRQMPANVLTNFLTPLPPLAEQQRIVAKVDELMVLCDKFKARLQEAQTTQIHLADAIVEQAVG